MNPRVFAESLSGKLALILESTGSTRTYGELEARANQAAHLFRSAGLRPGDTVAMCLENCLDVFDFCWAAQRTGLYYVPISSRATGDEVSYLLRDSSVRLLLTSDEVAVSTSDIVNSAAGLLVFSTGKSVSEAASWQDTISGFPTTPIDDEAVGALLVYSSGTTGHPKGIIPSPTGASLADTEEVVPGLFQKMLGADEETVFLCPAPLYHSAPLNCTLAMQRIGATSVVMGAFAAERALSVIEAYGVTHAQFVPTHFVRMLKLPEEVRQRYSVSTLRTVIHSAAPCPVPVKKEMLDWWGPIIHEYYAGSESNGGTFITAEEWLQRPGSVGTAVFGRVHICDEHGNELPARSEGLVYFQGGREFHYRNDPSKTWASRNRWGWSTMGDIGWQDEEGYLYLTDRQSFTIISGGVNVYPQEIENHLVTHPDVLDAAVIGAPDPDMGEKVVAVVQPRSMAGADAELAQRLVAFCRTRLSGIKVPRQIDFVAELPRTETGKLIKRLLREKYWAEQTVSSGGP